MLSFGIPNIIKNMFLTTMRQAFHATPALCTNQYCSMKTGGITSVISRMGRNIDTSVAKGKSTRIIGGSTSRPFNPASYTVARGDSTQKPLELYERFIKASSDVGDIVLDPFAGFATTHVYAVRLKP